MKRHEGGGRALLRGHGAPQQRWCGVAQRRPAGRAARPGEGAPAGCCRSWPKAGRSAATVRTDAVRPPEGAGGGARRRGRGRAGGGCEAAVRR